MSTATEKYITRDQVFSITCHGLKPSTEHTVSVGTTGDVKPSGGSKGDPLITDASGSLSFDFYHTPSGDVVPETSFELAENMIHIIPSTIEVVVSSASGDSTCSSTIRVVTTQSTAHITPSAIIDIVETPYVAPIVDVPASEDSLPPVIVATNTITRGGGCPAPWIEILMEGGKTIPASELKIGDKVWTQHENTLQWGAFKVTDHQILSDVERWDVEFDSGEVFVGTHNHRVKTTDGWLEIDKLQRGMEVVTPTGTAVVSSSKYYDRGDVVLITVSEAHTYISSGILSHNIKMDKTAFQNLDMRIYDLI